MTKKDYLKLREIQEINIQCLEQELSEGKEELARLIADTPKESSLFYVIRQISTYMFYVMGDGFVAEDVREASKYSDYKDAVSDIQNNELECCEIKKVYNLGGNND